MVKLRRHRLVQPQAPMRPWLRPHPTVMKSIRRMKLTPPSHRISHVLSRSFPRLRRLNRPVFHVVPVTSRTLPRDLVENPEITLRRRIARRANTRRRSQQHPLTLHDINRLIRQRNFHLHRIRILRTMRHHLIRTLHHTGRHPQNQYTGKTSQKSLHPTNKHTRS